MKGQIVDGVSYRLEGNRLLSQAYGETQSVTLDPNAQGFCVGAYGDGCGGGRIFVLYESCIKVYMPDSEEVVTLLEGLDNAKEIDKQGCILTIHTLNEVIEFNLSTMTKEKK